MKKVFIFLSSIIITQIVLAQDTNKIVINPVDQNEQDLQRKIFQYPQFLPGKAIYNNGTVTEAKLNYSYLSNNVLFIDPKGDTLELSQGENFGAIAIGTDTFRYYKKEFLQQLSNNTACNLFLRRSLKYNGQEKKGAYGTYSGTTSTSSYNNVNANESGGYQKLTPDQNNVYIFYNDYYFTNKYGQLYPATKKGVQQLFSKNDKQLKNFLEQNPINFEKREDLDKVLAFALTVLK